MIARARRERIAARFAYEFHDADGQRLRAYGYENWQFDDNGLMRWRHASINDVPTNPTASSSGTCPACDRQIIPG